MIVGLLGLHIGPNVILDLERRSAGCWRWLGEGIIFGVVVWDGWGERAGTWRYWETGGGGGGIGKGRGSQGFWPLGV